MCTFSLQYCVGKSCKTQVHMLSYKTIIKVSMRNAYLLTTQLGKIQLQTIRS